MTPPASFSAKTRSALLIFCLAVIFLAVNLASDAFLKNARFDLTERRLFTLSPGAVSILQSISSPVTLRLFFSRRAAAPYPQITANARLIRDLLREMEGAAEGRIRIEIIDPAPFSEEEDLALAAGLRPLALEEGERLYFGLKAYNQRGADQTIAFFGPDRESLIEYDLMRLIQALSQPQKPVLGIMTSLPLDTGPEGLAAAVEGRAEPYLIYRRIQERFRIEFLEQGAESVPSSIKLLLLAHPKPLSEKTLYAIDQFVMNGGRLLAVVDPHSELSLLTGPNGRVLRGTHRASSLEPLLTAWGVGFSAQSVIADRGLAQKVVIDAGRGSLTDYVLWLSLKAGNMNEKDPITASLNEINLATAGSFTRLEGSDVRFDPLLFSSPRSMSLSVDDLEGQTPVTLLKAFHPSDRVHVFAARLEGRLTSAFSEPPEQSEIAPHRDRTEGEAALVLLADSDLFDDRFWAHNQEGSIRVFADNGAFILNALETLIGSPELISLRGRETAARPFHRVEALAREAAARLEGEETRLREKIAALEERRPDGEDTLILPPSEEAAFASLRRDLLESRKALRAVQQDLRHEIERLFFHLRLVNIVLMPLIVLLAALLGGLRRRAGLRRVS